MLEEVKPRDPGCALVLVEVEALQRELLLEARLEDGEYLLASDALGVEGSLKVLHHISLHIGRARWFEWSER